MNIFEEEDNSQQQFNNDFEAGYAFFENNFQKHASQYGDELALESAMAVEFDETDTEFGDGFNQAITDLTGRENIMYDENPAVLGKVACLLELAEMIDEGADYYNCLGAINDTVMQPLDKHASQYTPEEIDYRHGVESVCYSFLKEASDAFALYDFSEYSPEEVGAFILEKVAEAEASAPETGDKVKKSMGDRLRGARDYVSGKASSARGAAGDAFTRHFRHGGHNTPLSDTARKTIEDRMKSGIVSEEKGKAALRGGSVRKGKLALTALGGTAALAGLGYGAKKLYDKATGGQEKKSEDEEIMMALRTLESHGYNINIED